MATNPLAATRTPPPAATNPYKPYSTQSIEWQRQQALASMSQPLPGPDSVQPIIYSQPAGSARPPLSTAERNLALQEQKFQFEQQKYQQRLQEAAARQQTAQQTMPKGPAARPPAPSKPTQAPKAPARGGGKGGGGGGGKSTYAKSPEQKAREEGRYERAKDRENRRTEKTKDRRDNEARAKAKGYNNVRAMEDAEATNERFDQYRQNRQKTGGGGGGAKGGEGQTGRHNQPGYGAGTPNTRNQGNAAAASSMYDTLNDIMDGKIDKPGGKDPNPKGDGWTDPDDKGTAGGGGGKGGRVVFMPGIGFRTIA